MENVQYYIWRHRFFVFLIAAILILIASIKSWENVNQITSIAAYIKVFYEYPSIHSEGTSRSVLMWETMQIQTNAWDPRKHKYRSTILKLLFNGSYLILELATDIIIIAILFNAGIINGSNLRCFVPVTIVMLFVIIIIGRLTFVDNFTQKKQEQFLTMYAEAAIEQHVIDATNVQPDQQESIAQHVAKEILKTVK